MLFDLATFRSTLFTKYNITTKTNNSNSLAAKKSPATLSSENPPADFYNVFAHRIKTDASAHRYLIVKAGDTLYSLANKSLVSKEKLIQINNLKAVSKISGRLF